MLKSSKFMAQLHCNRWSDIADCLTFLSSFPVILAILDLDFLMYCRKNSIFPKFLQFKVSYKQLRASQAYISCQKHLLNQEVNNKEKAVKILQEKVIEGKFERIVFSF